MNPLQDLEDTGIVIIPPHSCLATIKNRKLQKEFYKNNQILSILQMSKGILVATVALNGAANASILPTKILGHTDRIIKYQNELEDKVEEMNREFNLFNFIH